MENGNDRSSESVQETLNILRSDLVFLREQDISLLQRFMQMHFTIRMLQRSNRNWRRTNSLMPPSKVRPTSHRKRVNVETTSDTPGPHTSGVEPNHKDITLGVQTLSKQTEGPNTSVMTTGNKMTSEETKDMCTSRIECDNKCMTSDLQTTSEMQGPFALSVAPTKHDVMRDRFAVSSYKQRHPMLIRVKSEPAPYGCISAEDEEEEGTPDCSLDAGDGGLGMDANIASDSTELLPARKNSLKLSLDFADSPTTDILDDMPSFLRRQYLNALTSHASVAKVFFKKIQNPDRDTDLERSMEQRGRRLERQKAVCCYSTENSIDSD